jgi:hypothetical protein
MGHEEKSPTVDISIGRRPFFGQDRKGDEMASGGNARIGNLQGWT